MLASTHSSFTFTRYKYRQFLPPVPSYVYFQVLCFQVQTTPVCFIPCTGYLCFQLPVLFVSKHLEVCYRKKMPVFMLFSLPLHRRSHITPDRRRRAQPPGAPVRDGPARARHGEGREARAARYAHTHTPAAPVAATVTSDDR